MPEIKGKKGNGTVRMNISEESENFLRVKAEEKANSSGQDKFFCFSEISEVLIKATKGAGHKREIPHAFILSFLKNIK